MNKSRLLNRDTLTEVLYALLGRRFEEGFSLTLPKTINFSP